MPCTCLEQVPSSTQFSEHTWRGFCRPLYPLCTPEAGVPISIPQARISKRVHRPQLCVFRPGNPVCLFLGSHQPSSSFFFNAQLSLWGINS
jgi:hypothetical protein